MPRKSAAKKVIEMVLPTIPLKISVEGPNGEQYILVYGQAIYFDAKPDSDGWTILKFK